MSELCENLRAYKNDVNFKEVQIYEISRGNKSTIFGFLNNLPLLKTTDTTVRDISFSPWCMS